MLYSACMNIIITTVNLPLIWFLLIFTSIAVIGIFIAIWLNEFIDGEN